MNFKMKMLKRMISLLCAVSVVASSGAVSVGAVNIVEEQAKVGNFKDALDNVNYNIAIIKSNFEQIKKKNIGGNYDKLIEDVLKAIVDLDKLEVKEIDANFNNLSDNIFLLSLESGSWVEKQQLVFKEEPKEFENFKNDCEEFIKSVHLLTDYNMKKDDKENNDDGEFHQNHSNSMCELQNKLKLKFDEETSEENNGIDQSISFEYSDDGFQSIEPISPFGSVIANNLYGNNDNIKYLREKMEQLELKIKEDQSGLLDELNSFVKNVLRGIEDLKLIEAGSNDSEFKTVEEDSISLSFAVEDLIEEIESGKGASKESVEIFKGNCDNFTADALIFKNNNVITDNDDNQSFVSFSDEGKFENNENNENNKNMNTRTSNVYALLNPSVDVDSNVIENIFGSFGEHIQSENIDNNNNNADSALEISNVLNEDNNSHERSNIIENNGSNSNVAKQADEEAPKRVNNIVNKKVDEKFSQKVNDDVNKKMDKTSIKRVSNIANKKVDKKVAEKLIKKRNNVQNKRVNKKSTKKASNVANKKVDKELTKKINNSMSKNFNMNNVAIRPFRKINMEYNNVYKVSGVSKQSINSIFGNVNEGMSNEKFKKSGEDITKTFVRAAIEGRSFEDYLRINFGRLNSAQKQLYEIATAAYNKGQIIKRNK